MMTDDERKLRGRVYWQQRKDRLNAHKRAKYFSENYESIQNRIRQKEVEAEVRASVPDEKFNPKSDSEKQAFIRKVKSNPCQDCGNPFHSWVMEFDHRNPETKLFPLARAFHNGSVSLKRIQEEMAKCDLLCANCHRLRTARRSQGLPATLPPPEYHI